MALEEQFVDALLHGKNLDTIFVVKEGVPCFVFTGVRFVTPIWYSVISSSWHWTPDGIHWMPVSTLVVTGGFWKGRTPAKCNKYIIKKLATLGDTIAEKWLLEQSSNTCHSVNTKEYDLVIALREIFI